MRKINLALVVIWLVSGYAAATPNNIAGQRSITITGRTPVTVSKPVILLNDLAEITSDTLADDEAVIALGKITVAAAPLPGKETSIDANTIIGRLKQEGVNLEKIGYALPRSVLVKRAGRTIGEAEISRAISEFLAHSSKEMQVGSLHAPSDLVVDAGEIDLKALSIEGATNAQRAFSMLASSKFGERTEFKVTARVEEWRQVPVATRPLAKGVLINQSDFVMARLNTSQLPADAATESDQLLGLKVKEDLGIGEVFRRNQMLLPAAIETGARVSMVYRSGGLEASASGIALESGHIGQIVKIRNENSNKVISGKVIESGLVEVAQ
ncbi:MAG: flagella basal body P-ring formation protein FlgA [Proteobacteria bacterium]|nr:MAG: flagella basal body P-ring formation protein FlgA [Pseudomonadota bacterium]